MRNSNRFFNDFRMQTKETVCKYLNLLATRNYSLYSTHFTGLYPHLQNQDVYVYSDASTVVLVCLDCCGNNIANTYEESTETAPFIYCNGCEPRVSMVWKLSAAMKQVKECLQADRPSIHVYGVLLTEANILNAIDLSDVWENMNIKVVEGFKSLGHTKIKTNEDDDLMGKACVDAILEAALKAQETEECASVNTEPTDEQGATDDDSEIDSEFERMLTEFINREYDKEYGGNTSDDDESDSSDDETDDLFLGDADDDKPEEEVFPDGTIEQNNNVTVQVKILRPIANPYEELDNLVGCNDIKQRIEDLLALTSYNTLMRSMFPESKPHDVSLHSIFLGRPGTGKTTVCKIFGSLLRQAGALSKGHVVVCDRGTFLGTLWGDEERSVRQVVEKAQGGVLMIDEAYLLNSGHAHDPGRNVIQQLMNILADETQRDIAIVLCGYKEPMMKLLDVNPGLASRFPNKFEFHDFTTEELMEITRRRMKVYDYKFTSEAWDKYRRLLDSVYQGHDPQTWGNARFVANQLERIYIQHASRCVKLLPKDKESWRVITPEDIVPIEVPRQRARIGF